MTSTIFLGLASIALAVIFHAQAGSYPAVAQRLPTLLIWIVIGLAVLMIAEDVYKRRKAARGTQAVADDTLPAINWPMVLQFGIAIVVYVALIPVAGYLIATPLFIAGILVAGRALRMTTTLMIAVGLTAFLWAVFVWALNLPVNLVPTAF